MTDLDKLKADYNAADVALDAAVRDVRDARDAAYDAARDAFAAHAAARDAANKGAEQ
jgi:hypothetical protein